MSEELKQNVTEWSRNLL